MRFLVKKCRHRKRLDSEKANAISYGSEEVFFYSKKHCPFTLSDNPNIYYLDIPEWMFVKFDWKQKLDIELINREAKDEYELQTS